MRLAHMDDLDREAEKLKDDYPGCRETIDRRVAEIRERGSMGEYKGVDQAEILNDLRARIQREPCAQKRGGTKRSGPPKRRRR